MEKADQELLLRLVDADTNLKKIYQQHQKLEKEVEKYGKYAAFSSAASIKERELKKEKLRHKEHLMGILQQYREGGPSNWRFS